MDTNVWPNIDRSLLPDDSIFKLPSYNELSESQTSSLMGNIQFPYVIKNKLLISEGIWNNFYYSSECIKDAYNNTNWGDRSLRNLFLDHEDLRTSEWVGEVTNIHAENDAVYGDLIIYDPLFATKMAYGKPKFGISPKVHGDADRASMVMKDFTFENFSIVINPAVKTAYINNMEVQDEMDETDTNEILKQDTKLAKEEINNEVSEYYDFVKKTKTDNPSMSYEDIAKAWSERPVEGSEFEEIKSQLNELEDIKSQLKEIKDILKIVNGGEKMSDETKVEAPKEEKPAEVAQTEALKPEEVPVSDAPEVITEEAPTEEIIMETNEEVKEEPIAVAPEPVAEVKAPVEAPKGPARDELGEIASKLAIIEKKLDAPDRLSIKGIPGSAAVKDPDEGMLKYLEKMGSKEVI